MSSGDSRRQSAPFREVDIPSCSALYLGYATITSAVWEGVELQRFAEEAVAAYPEVVHTGLEVVHIGLEVVPALEACLAASVDQIVAGEAYPVAEEVASYLEEVAASCLDLASEVGLASGTVVVLASYFGAGSAFLAHSPAVAAAAACSQQVLFAEDFHLCAEEVAHCPLHSC